MVYLDYEIVPANRVFENRKKTSLIQQRMTGITGQNFLTQGLYYSTLFMSFGYFIRKFWIRGHTMNNAVAFLAACVMSGTLAGQMNAVNLLNSPHLNELAYIEENRAKTHHLFKLIEFQEANKDFTKL